MTINISFAIDLAAMDSAVIVIVILVVVTVKKYITIDVIKSLVELLHLLK